MRHALADTECPIDIVIVRKRALTNIEKRRDGSLHCPLDSLLAAPVGPRNEIEVWIWGALRNNYLVCNQTRLASPFGFTTIGRDLHRSFLGRHPTPKVPVAIEFLVEFQLSLFRFISDASFDFFGQRAKPQVDIAFKCATEVLRIQQTKREKSAEQKCRDRDQHTVDTVKALTRTQHMQLKERNRKA